jgi:glyoxylase-like metal-dependent hydrolase (beta-lactamase superfamily II)
VIPWLAGLSVASAALSFFVLSAGAQTNGLAVQSPRLYVMDCGLLKRGEPKAYGLTTEQVGGVTDFANPCFLVVHPRGLLLWDAGIVPDALVRPDAAGGTEIPGNNWAFKTLKSQLAELGYSASDIRYLAMSHSHGDHVANANDYAGATWLVQQTERDAMFDAASQTQSARGANYAALRESKTVLLAGDHDVFGDGTVTIVSTPGHTPGHQALLVRLARSGPVLLSGDLYHYAAERTLGKVPGFEYNADQTRASRAKVDELLKKTGAQLWIQHDFGANAGLKKSPAFYD